jgi:hypothetical protein
MQSIISETVKDWGCTDIYVGCSGNFTVERVLSEIGKFNLHSNDVTLYSSMLGGYAAGKPIKIGLNEEHLDQFGWLEPHIKDPADAVATIMLATRFMIVVGKHNSYYNRLLEAYKKQWSHIHGKTADKVRNLTMKLKSYALEDVCEWIDTVPEDQGIVCYPPFYAGDYENQNAKLEKIFTWQPPEYTMLTDERKDELLRKFMSKKYWAFGVPFRIPGLEGNLKGMTKTTNRGVPLYLYTGGGKTRITVPRQEIERVTIPRLAPGQEIGNKISLTILTGGQFSALRSKYMNENIKPGTATMALGVLVDGYLIWSICLFLRTKPRSLGQQD